MIDVQEAIQGDAGLVDPRVFTDEDLYREEMTRIFHKTWLYVGHETSIPSPGDYLVNYMGEEEVIVVRDARGKIRVYRNECAHRGNKVCLFDRGNQKVFTCTFHGWSFDLDGRLTGQAFSNLAYPRDFPRERWGLIEVPRVSTYGGLIFASWDPEACSLDEYLGDFKRYLDVAFLRPYLGGIEVLPGRGRYRMPLNWKWIAENFLNDDYHVPITHASFFKASMESGLLWWGLASPHDTTVQVMVVAPSGAPHGFGDVSIWGDPRPNSPFQIQPQLDRAIAQGLGPEAVEWVEERHRRIAEYVQKAGVPPVYGAANWTVFPNLSLLTGLSAFRAASIIQWHPKGPMLHEAWQWCAVERDAPESVKRQAMIFQAADQSPTGMITIDDTENFERAEEMLRARQLRGADRPFNLEAPGQWEEIEKGFREAGIDLSRLPGQVLPELSETSARAYYRYYRQLMTGARA